MSWEVYMMLINLYTSLWCSNLHVEPYLLNNCKDEVVDCIFDEGPAQIKFCTNSYLKESR